MALRPFLEMLEVSFQSCTLLDKLSALYWSEITLSRVFGFQTTLELGRLLRIHERQHCHRNTIQRAKSVTVSTTQQSGLCLSAVLSTQSKWEAQKNCLKECIKSLLRHLIYGPWFNLKVCSERWRSLLSKRSITTSWSIWLTKKWSI